MLKVSVIVPVFNPGHNIDDCIGSLLGQSLPPDEYEVIFVDDGSSDGTEARLDALAAEHEHVRVEHIPNSGWPGKPRNIGIEMARGEFVYFVDNDDWIGNDALKRLYDRAQRDEADIVIGRVVGEGKFVARTIFRRDRKDVTLEWPPLLRLLTPHKLFRKAMLDEHGIRFPEGRRRLEDHVFTMHAYFHARSISVLARYPCYHWVLRDDGENASTGEFDAEGYYANVREVLDLVDEHMEPGPRRERVRSHWYRGKMLGRVGGRGFVKRRPEFQRRLYEEIHALALERFTEDVHEWLSFSLTLRSRLLRAGRYEALEALSGWESTLHADVTVLKMSSRRDGVRVRVEGRMRDEHGPVAFERRDERYFWVPPAALDGEFPPEALDATDAIKNSNVDLLLSRTSGGPEYVVPTETELQLEPIEGRPEHVAAVVRGEAFIDPERAAAETKLRRGKWDLGAAMWTVGFAAPRAEVLRRGEPLRLLVTHGGRLVPPGWRRQVLERLPAVVRAVGRLRARLIPGRQAGSAGAREPAATGEPAPNSMSTTRSAARPSSSSQKVDTKS